MDYDAYFRSVRIFTYTIDFASYLLAVQESHNIRVPTRKKERAIIVETSIIKIQARRSSEKTRR